MRWMILVQIFYGKHWYREIYSIHTKRVKNKEETNTSNIEWYFSFEFVIDFILWKWQIGLDFVIHLFTHSPLIYFSNGTECGKDFPKWINVKNW